MNRLYFNFLEWKAWCGDGRVFILVLLTIFCIIFSVFVSYFLIPTKLC